MVAVGLALEIEKVLHCCLCCSWEGSVADHASPCPVPADGGSQWYGKHLPFKCESLA